MRFTSVDVPEFVNREQRAIRLPSVLLLAVAIGACATVSSDVRRLDAVHRAPLPPQSVQLLLDEPEKPYVAIAVIEVRDNGSGASLDSLRNRLRAEAGALGGQGVILDYHKGFEGQQLFGKVIVFRTPQPD